MKKPYLLLACLISSYVLCSCSNLLFTKPGVTFYDYETFAQNKSEWTEPENYSFTYKYCIGDSVVYEPVTVTVTNGNSVLDYGNNIIYDDDGNSYNPVVETAKLESIKEIYELFDSEYEDRALENSRKYTITFNASFSTTETGLKYPCILNENIELVHSYAEDIDGYGGIYIRISDFKLN